MRTRDEINDDRRDHGIIGTLEAVMELLFDIRTLLVTDNKEINLAQVKAALLIDTDVGL